MLQLTASPWTTEESTRERWQFGALTNRKATSSNRDPSLTSLYYHSAALSLYKDKWTTIIRLWWLSQWLFTHRHHLTVTIYLHVAPSTDRHNSSVATGGFGGLSPHQTNLQAPQMELWNTKNQWIFCQILECQAPLHKHKASLFKTFRRRFCL